MSIGIPGSRGLFSLLQEGFRHTNKDRIRLTQPMLDQLADFEYLAMDLNKRPTSLSELVPDHPVAVGPHDASGKGMGGAWLPSVTNSNLDPIIWRARFPPKIVDSLVSHKNPHGTINNSELELAGMIAHNDILQQQVNCAGRTIVPLGDNTAAVLWEHKASVTTTGPASYLLRLHSLHQRHYRYLSKADYIPGPVNAMADDCSRLWHLTDTELLQHFNSNYPQAQPWQLVPLRPEMLSSLISALQKERQEPRSYLRGLVNKTSTGKYGKNSLPTTTSIATSENKPKQSSFLFSRYLGPVSDEVTSPPAVNLLELNKWRTSYGPSERRSPVWGPQTHV